MPPSSELAARLDAAPAQPPGQAFARTTFRGLVIAVDPAQEQFRLDNGAVVQVTGQTNIPPGSDAVSFDQLQLLVLQERQTLFARGSGELISSEPRVIAATMVTFQAR